MRRIPRRRRLPPCTCLFACRMGSTAAGFPTAQTVRASDAMAGRPFRFGIQLSSLPVGEWAESARRIEALGYSCLVVPDHFSATQWDPTTMLGGVAAVTRTLRIGALVYGIDYRHPVIYARQAATLQAMSGG